MLIWSGDEPEEDDEDEPAEDAAYGAEVPCTCVICASPIRKPHVEGRAADCVECRRLLEAHREPAERRGECRGRSKP